MVSFHFNEIELDCECDTNLQFCDSVLLFESMLTPVSLFDLDLIPKSTLTSVSIDFENEPPILDSHIPLMGKECEFQFLDLDSTLESKLTLEPKVDFPELVFILEPIILEPKSTIMPSHILLLDIGIEHDDSVMIFQD